MFLSITERNLLNALSLYLAARKTALRAAMSFRIPLTPEAHDDLRMHYANYFISLMSAVDILVSEGVEGNNAFEQKLANAFGLLSGSSSSPNYQYVRELRNAIVHRGEDVTAGMHFSGSFPLLIAPSTVADRKCVRIYPAFGFYLLEIIKGCESVIGQVIEVHLDSLGILDKMPDVELCAEEGRQFVETSAAIPGAIKKMAIESLGKVDWIAIHRNRIKKLREHFLPCNLSVSPEIYAQFALDK